MAYTPGGTITSEEFYGGGANGRNYPKYDPESANRVPGMGQNRLYNPGSITPEKFHPTPSWATDSYLKSRGPVDTSRALVPYAGGGNPNALVPYAGGQQPAMRPAEVLNVRDVQNGQGAQPPTLPAGAPAAKPTLGPRAGLIGGLAATAASMVPRSDDGSYLGEVKNNLLDTTTRIGTGMGAGTMAAAVIPPLAPILPVLGGIAGGAYDIGKKVWDGASNLAQLPSALLGGPDTRGANEALEAAMARNPQRATPEARAQLEAGKKAEAGTGAGAILTDMWNGRGDARSNNGESYAAAPQQAAAPAGPRQYTGPTGDEMAEFRRQTGTPFDPKSVNDKLNLERMRGKEETFDSAQANAYRRENPAYRPGQYSKG